MSQGETPVISRDPEAPLPGDLPHGMEVPDDLDPLADGVLMRHQIEWVEDKSDLKLGEKGRRTGITFAEAIDDTLIAASARSAGGDNIFYIGDTKEKGREFIGYVAKLAKTLAGELAAVSEFMFEDERKDGTTRYIAAYRITFASGFRVEALSSRPENIRGLQGIVVIDEAAFHKDVREVMDAVNALLIWGGKVRVISTHNGVLNPFNELIREAKAGKVPFSCHFIPFSKAVENGLFKRVCAMRKKPWSQVAQDEWEKLIRSSYGVRTAAMKQELDAIPQDQQGAALTRVQIEACMQQGIPIIRWALPDEFKNWPEHQRKAETLAFCNRELLPLLERLDKNRPHYLGQDFARSGDGSDIVIGATDQMLRRVTQFVLEMRNVAVAYSRSNERLKEIYDNAVARLEGIASGKKGGLTFVSNASGGVGGETVTTSPGQAIVEAPERQFSRDRMW